MDFLWISYGFPRVFHGFPRVFRLEAPRVRPGFDSDDGGRFRGRFGRTPFPSRSGGGETCWVTTHPAGVVTFFKLGLVDDYSNLNRILTMKIWGYYIIEYN